MVFIPAVLRTPGSPEARRAVQGQRAHSSQRSSAYISCLLKPLKRLLFKNLGLMLQIEKKQRQTLGLDDL